MSPSAALKVAVVGPTHPYKGGVAAHTTSLAHELAEAGHDVTLVSWSHLYPSRLYPGEQAVPGGAPDVEPFPRTVRALSWARPDTWVRTGRRLRGFDVVVVVHVIPAVVPAHLALLRAAGVGRRSVQRGARHAGPRTVVIAHNVLPHETHPGDRELMRQFLERVDSVLVHSDAQARLAYELGRPAGLGHRPAAPPAGRRRRSTASTTTAPRGCSPSAWSATTRASTCSWRRWPTCPDRPSPWPARCGVPAASASRSWPRTPGCATASRSTAATCRPTGWRRCSPPTTC